MINSVKNIGFVSYWFNRGQAVVTRYVRSIFDEAGYNTFVLVRSAKEESLSGDWAGDGITIGSKEYNMDKKTYIRWVKKNKLDAVFFFQNYQFEEIKAIRKMGVKTIGTFMWEQFGQQHVQAAKESFDVIYSLTKCQQDRYENILKMNTEPVRWGIHPSLLRSFSGRNRSGPIWFYYPAGYCSGRKAVYEVVKAFSMVDNDNIRLLVSSQKKIKDMGNSRKGRVKGGIEYDEFLRYIQDPRIKVNIGNVLSHDKFHATMQSCDVCILPSKWEGLGLAFVESIAFEMPIVATDYPPMNEYVVDGETGFLVRCNKKARRQNGIRIANISVGKLADKISRLADRETIRVMSDNTRDILQDRFSWDSTRKDYIDLLDRL
jgi:glycosyltransferase involved in cell wall biosynthesis